MTTRGPSVGQRLEQLARVLVAAVLGPHQAEDRELDLVRLAPHQRDDAVVLGVGEAELATCARRRVGQCGDERGRLEQPEPVGRAGQRVDGVLGMRHQPDDVAGRVADARDVARRAVEAVAGRVAEHDLAVRLELVEHRVGRPVAAGLVLGRDREPVARARTRAVHFVSALTTSSSTWRQTKRSDVFGSSAPGSSPASHSTWKPLQMPSTSPPWRGEALDLHHDRREARERAGAQVVAVGEAAGDDHRVDALQVVVAVPQQHGVADARRRVRARRARRTSRGTG